MTTIDRIPDLSYNPILDTDSYKPSHATQYPAGMTSMHSHFLARGGQFTDSTLFGLQYVAHKYLLHPAHVDDVREALAFFSSHGEPFAADSCNRLWRVHGGYWPVRIRAIPEGLVVPVGTALYTVDSTDPELAWVAQYIETMLARLWYPSTIATASREFKKVIRKYLELSSDNPDAEIGFKLHDFGARGCTCYEQSCIGGAAHLTNFLGSDTVAGIRTANQYYHSDMAAFSIPATEHSTVLAQGRDREFQFVEEYVRRELVQRQLPPGVPKLAACVGDTYDIYNFADHVTQKQIRDLVWNSGGTLVVRPDSGDPLQVLPRVLGIMWMNLENQDYKRVNAKGFKVLPDCYRIIQGDGIDLDSVEAILSKLTSLGWSASNIAFGSGGGLLQKWNRDTQKFKYAASSVTVDGEEIGVAKTPITDPGKHSMPGRVDTVQHADGTFETIRLQEGQTEYRNTVMQTVYENGKVFVDHKLDDIRKRMTV